MIAKTALLTTITSGLGGIPRRGFLNRERSDKYEAPRTSRVTHYSPTHSTVLECRAPSPPYYHPNKTTPAQNPPYGSVITSIAAERTLPRPVLRIAIWPIVTQSVKKAFRRGEYPAVSPFRNSTSGYPDSKRNSPPHSGENIKDGVATLEVSRS